MIHIYCGDGKGKTTAALGLALRAAGNGMRVHIVQFMKGSETSELSALSKIPEITVRRCDRDYGFTFNMDKESRAMIKSCHDKMLNEACFLAGSGKTDMLILDEFCCAYNNNLLDRELADRAVLEVPDSTELILTGREPDKKFIEAADYVSEIKAVKHPYIRGITARKGIEY